MLLLWILRAIGEPGDAPRGLASPLVSVLPIEKSLVNPVSPAGVGRQPAQHDPHFIRMTPLRLQSCGLPLKDQSPENALDRWRERLFTVASVPHCAVER
jgi:hypothetical protein